MESRTCSRCGSVKLDYQKHIYLKYKDKSELAYHISEECLDCGYRHLVKRDAYTYQKTKDKQWIKSTNAKN